MDTLKVGMKHNETWEITEERTTQRPTEQEILHRDVEGKPMPMV